MYIDGGIIKQELDGQDHPYEPMNSTLSIDISKSWSADTVEFKVTPKTNEPVTLSSQAIWNHPSGNAFYIFGGKAERTNPENIITDGIWKFTVDGKGGGSWAKEQPSNVNTFETISFADGMAFASTYGPSGGIGFSIGGTVTNTTEPQAKFNASGGVIWRDGMVAYDMETKTVSSSDISMAVSTGSTWHSRAQFVPQFGPNGLVFLIGGFAGNKSNAIDSGLDFGNISFFDPKDRKWRWQSTRGSIPQQRAGHCMVGVPGPAGTFEM